MTVSGYLTGLALLLVTVASVLAASARLRRRFVPGWTGALGALAGAVGAIAILTTVARVLGAVGLFRRWPLALGALAVALLVVMSDRTAGQRRPERSAAGPPPGPGHGPRPRWAAVALTAVVVAQWLHRSVISFEQGITDIDSLDYHAPFAARFVQEGWLTNLHVQGGLTTFYPADGSLIQAIVMAPFGRDLLSPFVNLGWLALALLAGWCVGRTRDVEPWTLAATSVAVGLPIHGAFNAGTAGNDIAVVALTLAAVAMIANTTWRWPELALVGMATGMGVGTKLNVLLPLTLLAFVVPLLATRSSRRPAVVATWTAFAATGSYWYVRNLLRTGNPFPWWAGELGPVEVPGQEDADVLDAGVPLARYAIHSDHWPELLDGMNRGYGRAWPLVVVPALAGLAVAVARTGDRRVRLVAVTGIAAVISYAATPISAGGLPSGFFEVNTRYAIPGLVIGLTLVPVLTTTRERHPTPRRMTWLLAGFAICVVAGSATGGRYTPWPDVGHPLRVATGVALVVVLALLLDRRRPLHVRIAGLSRRAATLAASVLVCVAVVMGWFAQQAYFETRYLAAELTPPVTAVDRWAQRLHDRRIGLAGSADYPLYGPDLSNHVERVMPVPDDDPARCSTWRRLLAEGGYDLVVVRASRWATSAPPEAAWTRAMSGAVEVFTHGHSSVFALPDQVQAEACPPADPLP
jgi:hypothetical protein